MADDAANDAVVAGEFVVIPYEPTEKPKRFATKKKEKAWLEREAMRYKAALRTAKRECESSQQNNNNPQNNSDGALSPCIETLRVLNSRSRSSSGASPVLPSPHVTANTTRVEERSTKNASQNNQQNNDDGDSSLSPCIETLRGLNSRSRSSAGASPPTPPTSAGGKKRLNKKKRRGKKATPREPFDVDAWGEDLSNQIDAAAATSTRSRSSDGASASSSNEAGGETIERIASHCDPTSPTTSTRGTVSIAPFNIGTSSPSSSTRARTSSARASTSGRRRPRATPRTSSSAAASVSFETPSSPGTRRVVHATRPPASAPSISTSEEIPLHLRKSPPETDGCFSPRTERVKQHIVQFLGNKSTPERAKILESVITDSRVTTKPSIAQSLFTSAKKVAQKLIPSKTQQKVVSSVASSTEPLNKQSFEYYGIMLLEMQKLVDDEGAEIHGVTQSNESIDEAITEILEETDGCCVQYRCANALHMAQKLAMELDVIYDRAIDAPGHGKKDIDGFNGTDKRVLDSEFRGNVEHQPEALNPLKKETLLYQMCDGTRIDIADIAQKVLSRPDRADGQVAKVEPNKPRKPSTGKSSHQLSSRNYKVRKKGVAAKWKPVRMKAIGFPAGKGNGMKFHYNFRFERAIYPWFAYRRIPCYCKGCEEELKKSSEMRYDSISNQCYLFPMMKKKDGSETSWNDWGKGQFRQADDCSIPHFHALQANTLQEMGCTYSTQVEVGTIGAHSCSDPKYDNWYLVMWAGEPERATEDKVIEFYGGKDSVTVWEGDWYCRAFYLDKLGKGAPNWWTRTDRECVVRLETVLKSDVGMLKLSDDNTNPLPERATTKAKETAAATGAWRISDKDKLFLSVEAKSRAALEYDDSMVTEVRDELLTEEQWAKHDGDDMDIDDEDNGEESE